jgi:hypothetical protein
MPTSHLKLNVKGVVTMTYLAALKKFVMVVSTPTFTPYTTKQFDTYMLESDAMTGPFRLVTYLSEASVTSVSQCCP